VEEETGFRVHDVAEATVRQHNRLEGYKLAWLKTVFFEKKYGDDIKRFSTTEQIDERIESKLGRKLGVKKIKTNLVTNRGCIIPIKKFKNKG